jgi:oligopeptide/dipeptide ABC transporter ATP-binding protein
MDNNKILEVKDLRISFKTMNGTVKAVRGINFSLYRGRTLAIVGESGSGKSVTSRAILGILAGNRIIEGGQIIYDGRDLLTLKEEQFTKIRGSRISMIFQDPMSSLNPIMKVGKQLTEAIVLKAKADKRHSRKLLNDYYKNLVVASDNKIFVKELYDVLKAANQNSEFDLEESTKEDLQRFLQLTFNSTLDLKKLTLEALQNDLAVIDSTVFTETEKFNYLVEQKKVITERVLNSIYKLSIIKDDLALTFKTSLKKYLTDLRVAIRRINKTEKDITVKQRAFSHEFIEKPDQVIEKLHLLFEVMIDKLTNELTQTLAKDEHEKVVAYLREEIARNRLARIDNEAIKNRAIALLGEVGIPEPEKRFTQYPFQFSGGMRQRIVIAISLASNPEILICDEPTTALDVTIQSQILETINRLKVERNLSVIFITHDLGVVANMADDIAVMYAGKIVEFGTVNEVFYSPAHPYTWALLSSMPDLNTKEKLEAIPGTPPNMILPPKGDDFAARNKYAMKIDFEEQPPLFKISETHYAATWLLHPDAPKVEMPKIVKERIDLSLQRYEKSTKKKKGGSHE